MRFPNMMVMAMAQDPSTQQWVQLVQRFFGLLQKVAGNEQKKEVVRKALSGFCAEYRSEPLTSHVEEVVTAFLQCPDTGALVLRQKFQQFTGGMGEMTLTHVDPTTGVVTMM